MTDPEKLARAEQLKQTEARLEHEMNNRIHAEQVLQAHIGDQAAGVAASHRPPADTSQDVISEACAPPTIQNPLEKVNAEYRLLCQALAAGTSLQDYTYDK